MMHFTSSWAFAYLGGGACLGKQFFNLFGLKARYTFQQALWLNKAVWQYKISRLSSSFCVKVRVKAL